jgi:hypothetical protein
MLAIVGMHIFGGSLGVTATVEDYDTETPANFETFSRGLLTVFELTVGEEWAHVMYWCDLRLPAAPCTHSDDVLYLTGLIDSVWHRYQRYASIGHGYPEWLVQIFFIGMYVWMNCILFSLCIAMMLEK